MPCCGQQNELPPVPEGAEVLSIPGTEHRLLYREGDYVIGYLKSSVRPHQVRERMAIAAAHPDLFVQIEYNEECHKTKRLWLGREAPTAEEITFLQLELERRELCIGDLKPDNIRGGKIIDFFPVTNHPEKKWKGVRCRKTKPITKAKTKRGTYVRIESATREQIEDAKLGKLIVWPTSSAAQ